MWSIFYRNPRLLLLTVLMICIWGLVSFYTLPRTEEPEISQYWATVTTEWPGASATRIESLVTTKIEEELFEIEEIERLESYSTAQRSTVIIRLQPTVQDIDQVWTDVRNRIDTLKPLLPSGTSTPEYEEIEPRAHTLIAGLVWQGNTPVNYGTLSRYSQQLADRLRQLSGTQSIELFGEPTEEISVEVIPERLATLGLTPGQVAEQIRLSDAKVSGGQVRADGNNLLVEMANQLDSVERIRQIPLQVETNTGQITTVGDLAIVRKGIQDPPEAVALIQGKIGVAIATRMENNKRIDRWVQDAQVALDDFRKQLPRSLDLEIIFDQSQYVKHRLNHLLRNLFFGAACVVATTVIMMGWRSALVVGISLPLSVLMVFGGMKALGIPLHQISISGLVMALGLLIDNAIVVVDELHHRLNLGLAPEEAIHQSIHHLAIPLLASTLTTALTFLPMALVSGEVGEFVGPLAYSVILSIFSSLILSLWLVPALDAYSYSKMPKAASAMGITIAPLTVIYRRVLARLLQRPWQGVAISLILPSLGLCLMGTLPEQFFPPAERDQLYVEVDLAGFSPLSKTQAIVEQAQEIILANDHVSAVNWFVGSNTPVFYYNLPQALRDYEHLATGMVVLKDAASGRDALRTLQQVLDQQLPKAQIVVRQLEQGSYIAAPIVIRLQGPDVLTLQQLGKQIRGLLAQVPEVIHSRASANGINPTLALTLDQEQIRVTGVNNVAIAQQLGTYLSGVVGGSILEDTEELPIRVRLSNQNRGDLGKVTTLDLLPVDTQLNALPQSTNQNRPAFTAQGAPLSNLAKIRLIPEAAGISRYNGERVNTIYAYIDTNTLPATALKSFKQQLANSNFRLPPGYVMEFGGEQSERNLVIQDLLTTVVPLLVIMMGILVLSFNSFRATSIIAIVGVGAVGLALTSLFVFRYPLGFMAILGAVGLIGIAINDSIVVLASLHGAPQVRQGNLKLTEDIIVRSTRHVLTTTFTTVAGFIPLIAAGGDFWPPLAICIAGGVLGATLLALFFVPCIYLIIMRSSRFSIA